MFKCIKVVLSNDLYEGTKTHKLAQQNNIVYLFFRKNSLMSKDGRTDYHTYNNWFRSVVALHRPGENPMECKNPENALHEEKTQIIESGYKT